MSKTPNDPYTTIHLKLDGIPQQTTVLVTPPLPEHPTEEMLEVQLIVFSPKSILFAVFGGHEGRILFGGYLNTAAPELAAWINGILSATLPELVAIVEREAAAIRAAYATLKELEGTL